MITVVSVLMMCIVAYAHVREGLLSAIAMCISVLIAGLVAFNFWEPLADLLEAAFRGGMLVGFEDVFALLALFCVSLAALRWLTNSLLDTQVEYPALLQQGGAGAVGLLTGYLLSGFLVCAFQTMPWHEKFMDFEPRSESEGGFRRYLPADRVWLSLMRYAGAYPLSATEASEPTSDSTYDAYNTFDRYGTFELRYLRYRRYGDTRNPLRYQGELARELYRTR